MDKIISKYDFGHNDEDQRRNFYDETDEWTRNSDNKENATANDVENALKALASKLSKDQVPDYETEGWEQAKNALDCIIEVVEESDNSIKAEQVQGFFLDFIIDLMEAGPKTVHLVLAGKVMDTDSLDMKECVENLQGDKQQRLVQAMVKDVSISEQVEEEDFLTTYERFMRHFKKNIFTKSLLSNNLKAFLEFQCRLCTNQWDKSEEWCKTFGYMGEDLFHDLDKPWETIEDFPAMKACFKRCNDVLGNPQFSSTHEQGVRCLKRYIENILCEILGKRGLIAEFCDELYELLVAISQWSYQNEEAQQEVFRGAMRFIRNLKEPHNKKKPALFQKARKCFIEALEKIDVRLLDDGRFCYATIDDLLEPAYAKDKKLTGEYVGILSHLLKKPCMDTFRSCREIVSSDDNIKWKDHPEVAKEVLGQLCEMKIPENYEEKQREECVKDYVYFVKQFLDGLKKSKILKNYGEELTLWCLQMVESKDPLLYELGDEIAERVELNVKESKKTIMSVLPRIHAMVDDEDLPWDEERDFSGAINTLLEKFLEPVKDPKTYDLDELAQFVAICKSCSNFDSLDSNGIFSGRFLCRNAIVVNIIKWLSSLDRLDIAEDLLPGMVKDYQEEDDNLSTITSSYLTLFGLAKSGQKAVGKHMDELMKVYLDNLKDDVIRVIDMSYPANPKALQPYFREYMDNLINYGDQSCTSWMGQLFHKASKMQADLFTQQDMEDIVNKAKTDQANQPVLLQIVQELCKRRPDEMAKCMDPLLDTNGWNPMLLSWINDMLTALSVHDQTVAPKSLDFLLNNVRTHQDKANLLTGLNAIRLIGFKHPDLLAPRREEIANLSIADTDGQELKRTILDMIDGKTPQDLQTKLLEQQNDLNDLVGRVEDTEEAVAEMQNDISNQGQELTSVKTEVNEHGQRLDQVEDTVDETVAKVEEIDQKTLSHAPYWSRDVSKLLNPQSDHDWRLLSSRLGYSNDDIRGWAQQADPCMAMLNEWYATRKTSEATYAVYNQLIEMDRTDVAIIVENAMKNAEAVVEDEDFEYASPPPIFLSYQWGHQEEVKLLKQHLEMAGYECWLDIGQMGGGDKLFEKIDTGIRAAKVVISCVTEKYAKSPNCNREVNLSVNLNKPMIPLLLEKCTWPPPGSMGPIFSEYLFIRFFQRSGEDTTDERYWPKDKFQELLMQLNMFGLPPEEGKIDPMYKNWWMPVVEEIKIDKSKTRDGGKASKTDQDELDKKAADSPDVFISYQWGKQKNIIRLYQRLTSLGFTCWLDIKQMGGGDSLYDKIDRGVRGCRVVISCVTQKYSLSANCRREVSLADALKKPLIPLLLEDMTWPPSGPMSMVMTQLLYIDFQDENVQVNWDGPKFDELLDKIEENVPRPEEDTTDEKRPKEEKPTRDESSAAETTAAPTPAAKAAGPENKGESESKDGSAEVSGKIERHKDEEQNTSGIFALTSVAVEDSEETTEATTHGDLQIQKVNTNSEPSVPNNKENADVKHDISEKSHDHHTHDKESSSLSNKQDAKFHEKDDTPNQQKETISETDFKHTSTDTSKEEETSHDKENSSLSNKQDAKFNEKKSNQHKETFSETEVQCASTDTSEEEEKSHDNQSQDRENSSLFNKQDEKLLEKDNTPNQQKETISETDVKDASTDISKEEETSHGKESSSLSNKQSGKFLEEDNTPNQQKETISETDIKNALTDTSKEEEMSHTNKSHDKESSSLSNKQSETFFEKDNAPNQHKETISETDVPHASSDISKEEETVIDHQFTNLPDISELSPSVHKSVIDEASNLQASDNASFTEDKHRQDHREVIVPRSAGKSSLECIEEEEDKDEDSLQSGIDNTAPTVSGGKSKDDGDSHDNNRSSVREKLTCGWVLDEPRSETHRSAISDRSFNQSEISDKDTNRSTVSRHGYFGPWESSQYDDTQLLNVPRAVKVSSRPIVPKGKGRNSIGSDIKSNESGRENGYNDSEDRMSLNDNYSYYEEGYSFRSGSKQSTSRSSMSASTDTTETRKKHRVKIGPAPVIRYIGKDVIDDDEINVGKYRYADVAYDRYLHRGNKVIGGSQSHQIARRKVVGPRPPPSRQGKPLERSHRPGIPRGTLSSTRPSPSPQSSQSPRPTPSQQGKNYSATGPQSKSSQKNAAQSNDQDEDSRPSSETARSEVATPVQTKEKPKKAKSSTCSVL